MLRVDRLTTGDSSQILRKHGRSLILASRAVDTVKGEKSIGAVHRLSFYFEAAFPLSRRLMMLNPLQLQYFL
jgi:hypothetical protein